MILATSTNILYGRPGGGRASLEQTLSLASEAGFRVFDLNFYDWSLPGSVFLTDDWERWIDGVAAHAAKLGVTFGQCHAYFYDFLRAGMSDEQRLRHETLQARSFKCAAILGAHTCVQHPETDYSTMEITKVSLRRNTEYYNNILEQTSRYGFAIAIENMCDYGTNPRRKFCATPEELVDFVSGFGTERFGICWDFEHADIMEQDQCQSLMHIGKHLLATHVSDTHSKTDNTLMHVLPMTGSIDWSSVMPTLKKINYNRDFCYEVHNYINTLPDETVPTALKLAYEIGEYLVGLAK